MPQNSAGALCQVRGPSRSQSNRYPVEPCAKEISETGTVSDKEKARNARCPVEPRPKEISETGTLPDKEKARNAPGHSNGVSSINIVRRRLSSFAFYKLTWRWEIVIL